LTTTLASSATAENFKFCSLGECIGSDHLPILVSTSFPKTKPPKTPSKWKLDQQSLNAFHLDLQSKLISSDLIGKQPTCPAEIDEYNTSLTSIILQSVSLTVKKVCPSNPLKPT
jgi:hypothetical protein